MKLYKVTNIDKTPQMWRGYVIEPGKSIITPKPPEESYTFKVEPYEEKKKSGILKEE